MGVSTTPRVALAFNCGSTKKTRVKKKTGVFINYTQRGEMDKDRKSRASAWSMAGPPVFQYTSLYVRISEAKNLQTKDM